MSINKIQINPHKKYIWWKDKKMKGTILLICVVAAQIFAFLEVPFLSTIHSYTIGFWLGYYNPFFYLFWVYFALLMISENKNKILQRIKLSQKSYWLFVLSIICLATSTWYYQNKIGWTSIGSKPWQAVDIWFDNFTNEQKASFWAPKSTNGGFIGVLCFSFLAMITSGIGAFILSILFVAITISMLARKNPLKFYKKLTWKNKKIKENQELNLNQSPQTLDNENINKINKEKLKEDFPFEDPFRD